MISFLEFMNESAPDNPKAEQWIKANKDEFKKQYGDDWEEILYATAWKLFKEDMNTTQGVAMPDSVLKISKFCGHDTIDLSDDEYNKCIGGKIPFDRWSNYIENSDRQHAIKSLYHRSKKLIVRNEKTSAMVFIKR